MTGASALRKVSVSIRPMKVRFIAGCWVCGMNVAVTAICCAGDQPVIATNISYLGAGRTEMLDLYRPKAGGDASLFGAVVWIHGGGWVGGDKAAAREKEIGSVLSQAGYVCASINYRMGPGAWPTNLFDCKNAVRFLRAHAKEYNIDPARIAVMGGSAGGHLALMVGLTANEPDLEPKAPYPGVSDSVSAIGNFYGITDLATRQKIGRGGEPLGIPNLANANVFTATLPAGAELWKDVSPVNHITDNSPPIFIAHGLADTTVDYPQAQELDRELTAHKVPHRLVLIPGVGHTFDFENWNHHPLPIDLKSEVLEFLRQYIGNKG